MAFVGFFVVNGEGRIGVTESRYLKRDSYIYIERLATVIH